MYLDMPVFVSMSKKFDIGHTCNTNFDNLRDQYLPIYYKLTQHYNLVWYYM